MKMYPCAEQIYRSLCTTVTPKTQYSFIMQAIKKTNIHYVAHLQNFIQVPDSQSLSQVTFSLLMMNVHYKEKNNCLIVEITKADFTLFISFINLLNTECFP